MAQAFHAGFVHVYGDNAMTERGQTCAGNQTDITATNNRYINNLNPLLIRSSATTAWPLLALMVKTSLPRMSANANAATCIYSVIGHVAVEYIIHTDPGGQAGRNWIISQKAALVACDGETRT